MRTLSTTPLRWRLATVALSTNLLVIGVACGDTIINSPTAEDDGAGGDSAGSTNNNSTATGQGGATASNSSSGDASATNTTTATTGAGANGGGDDPFAADPMALVTLDSGDVSRCIPGLLTDGGAGAYAGFAGSSDGAYFVWRDNWDDAFLTLRMETWDAFGGITEPGTYTLTESDTNYADCAVCIFAEYAGVGELWPQAGDTITYTALATGAGGVDQQMVGTFEGTLSDGLCSAAVKISFNATARDINYGPL